MNKIHKFILIFLANSVTVTTPPPPSIELPKPNPNDEVPDDNESIISKGQSKSTASLLIVVRFVPLVIDHNPGYKS